MKYAIAQLAQHTLLATSLALSSTPLIQAQEATSTTLQVSSTHPRELVPAPDATEMTTNIIRLTAASDRSSPRTLQEAGLDPTSLRSATLSDLAIPATATSQAPAAPELAFYQPIAPQIRAAFTSGPGTGYDTSYFGLEGFVPLVQTPGQSLGYLQGHLNLDTAEGNPAGNVLLGYRHFNPDTRRILGGYVGVDVRDTGRKIFSQLGAGLEAVLPNVEFRVNGYLPLGSRDRQVSENSFDTTIGTANQITATRFQGNSLLFDLSGAQQQRTTTRNYEISLGGLDAEAGIILWRWSPVGNLKSYLGLYYYDGPRISGFVGIRGRLEARINENFHAGLAIQGDREFGTRAVVSVGFRFPGAGSAQDSPQQEAWARVGDAPVRQSNIAVTHRSTTDVNIISTTPAKTVVALNPATSQPWVFQHVTLGTTGGDGTFENPFATVANGLAATQTDGNSIVYVQAGTNPGIPAFTIPDNVQVLSTGPLQRLSTVQAGTVQLPLSGAGTLPTVTDTIKMGNNTVLSGFAVLPDSGVTAILANGVRDVTIRDNQAQTSGTNIPAVRLQNITGTATVSNNTLTTTGNSNAFPVEASGIEVDLNNTTLANLLLTNNQITTTGTAADAISIFPINNGAITALTISGNTLTTKGDFSYGIYLNPQSNGAIAKVDISNNTITTTGSGANGISLDINQPAATPLQATITNNTLNQIGGGGILFQNFGNTQATATIANNTISGATQVGIALEASDNSIFRVVVDSNQVSNTVLKLGSQVGIQVFSGDLAQTFASVTNNQVSNVGTFGSPNQVEYKFSTSAFFIANALLCVRALNNSANDSGYFFTNPAGNTLQLEAFTGNVGTRQPDSGTITNVAAGSCGF